MPHLDQPRVPADTEFRQVLELWHELAQDRGVRSPVEQKEPLIVKDPRPAPLGDQSLIIDQERVRGARTPAVQLVCQARQYG